MILVVTRDSYGDPTHHEFENIEQAKNWIASNYADYYSFSIYVPLSFDIEVKVTISEDVNIH